MGYIYILLTVAGLLAAASAKLTERLGEAKLCMLLFAAAGAACAVTAVTVNPVLSVAMIICLRIAASLFVPAGMRIQNRQVSIADRATLLSVYSAVMNTGAIFTNLIFGRLADIHVGWAFGAGTVFCITGMVLFMVWAKTNRSAA